MGTGRARKDSSTLVTASRERERRLDSMAVLLLDKEGLSDALQGQVERLGLSLEDGCIFIYQ
jgi:hypothetical protein